MSDQYLGEIRSFGFNFAPIGWLQCNGQILSISQYSALFSLLGTFYGGNGTSNFALPNLQGNVPMMWGAGPGLSTYFIGETTGSTTVTLISNQLPLHNHFLQVEEGGSGVTNAPSTATWLGETAPGVSYITTGPPNVTLAQTAIGPNTGGQPHENMQPYLTINFCIATTGTFPPRG